MYIRVIFLCSLNYRYILQIFSLIIHVLYVAHTHVPNTYANTTWMRWLIDIGIARRGITRKRAMAQQSGPVWLCSRIASITPPLTINNYPISLMICRNAFWPAELRPMATFPSFPHPLSALCHSGGTANLSVSLASLPDPSRLLHPVRSQRPVKRVHLDLSYPRIGL